MNAIEKGILAIGILLAVLAMATGSVSATDITECTVITSPGTYNIAENITNSTATYCINIQANDVIIDGKGHWIDGISPGDCGVTARAGIYNFKQDNVVIKNLEVKNFCYGIRFKGYYINDWDYDYVVNNTIDNCKVHDNGNPVSGATMGIELFAASHCKVINSEVYNNTGAGTGCGRGGMGIRMHGTDHSSVWAGYHTVTNNKIYGNRIAGIYSKKKSMHNYVADNDVYENGEVATGPYFGGGIRLQCMMTNYWTVENNNVTDNFGPGIYVRGSNNIIRYNNESGSKNASNVVSGPVGAGYGMYLSTEAGNNNVTANRFCDNEYYDICDEGSGNFGTCNTCDTKCPGTTITCCYPCHLPDLVITEKSEEWVSLLHRTYNVTYTVKNVGEGTAGASNTSIRTDTEEKIDPVPALEPDASYSSEVGPFKMSEYQDKILVCADYDGAVDESNETNNCLANVFQLTKSDVIEEIELQEEDLREKIIDEIPDCAASAEAVAKPPHVKTILLFDVTWAKIDNTIALYGADIGYNALANQFLRLEDRVMDRFIGWVEYFADHGWIPKELAEEFIHDAKVIKEKIQLAISIPAEKAASEELQREVDDMMQKEFEEMQKELYEMPKVSK